MNCREVETPEAPPSLFADCGETRLKQCGRITRERARDRTLENKNELLYICKNKKRLNPCQVFFFFTAWPNILDQWVAISKAISFLQW